MRTSSLRLLIVDDYRDGADAFAVLERIHGHRVEVCYSGVEAMLIASEFRPDVIFLDISMPDLDGCEVASFVRRSPFLADCT